MSIDPAALDAAARWYARLGADDLTASEKNAFDGWLAQDGAHRQAWQSVERTALRADMLGTDPALRAMIDEAAERPARSLVDRGRKRIFALAAVVAVVIAGGVAFQTSRSGSSGMAKQVALQEYATRAGETRPVLLSDGSRIVLDGQSRLRVGIGKDRRDVELVAGQALFRVAKETARPFVVSAGGYTVTALGTYFDVDLHADGIDVALVEGKVRVARISGGESWLLTPGMRLSLEGDRAALTHGKADAATDWSRGALHFDATPLADVVLQMNRRSAHKLVLDPSLAQRPFSGVIRVEGSDGEKALIEALEAYGIARVGRSSAQETQLIPY